MNKYVKNQILRFENDIMSVEKTNSNIDLILKDIKKRIKENTEQYFKIDDVELKEKIKSNLIDSYNLLYYFQAKKNGINRAYMLDDDIQHLPSVYLVEQKPEKFELNEELLNEINVDRGLTMDQALTLLKWTVNNTRDNLNIEEEQRLNIPGDVYGNSCLGGACGFSQFSSLYPLQQLGLEVTINNVGEISGCRHAYGTVVIPIKTDDKIINKRFLIDCTYRQFFTLPYNVVSRYLGTFPDAGFFVNQNKEEIEFAKELLKNGFVEASLENMEKYLKPFFSGSISIENTSKIDEEFEKIDIIEAIKNKQDEFDYTEQEFLDWGLNLSIYCTSEKHL